MTNPSRDSVRQERDVSAVPVVVAPVGRENAPTKARRLLAEGRVIVTARRPGCVEALCRGDSAHIYKISWRHPRGWTCSCNGRGRCSHLAAVAGVVVLTEQDRA